MDEVLVDFSGADVNLPDDSMGLFSINLKDLKKLEGFDF